jgi:AhpD family alkylhydroperoxidase
MTRPETKRHSPPSSPPRPDRSCRSAVHASAAETPRQQSHAPYLITPAGFRYPWYVRLIFWLQRRRYGRELEPARLWGRVPKAFLAMTAMYAALDGKSSPLDPALRGLIQVRVSQINWCSFCTDLNSANCLKRGISRDKLAALPRFVASSLFDEREKAALEYAEAITRTDRHTDAMLIARLQRHFSDEAIVALTTLIAFQNLSSKFNAGLGVPAQGLCGASIATAAEQHESYTERSVLSGSTEPHARRACGGADLTACCKV